MRLRSRQKRTTRVLRLEMIHSALFLLAFSFLSVGHGLVTPEYGRNGMSTGSRMGFRPSCRSALSQCLQDIDSGKAKQCETLPVQRRSFLKQIASGKFEVRKLRSGVWMYNDGFYLSLILLKRKRLVLIDFPDSALSNTNTGSGTLLTDAIEKVLKQTVPTRIDMVYSHAHFDHIGAATRVFKYSKKRFPRAQFFVWGSQETKELIEVHTSNLAVKVTSVITAGGKSLKLSADLKVKIMIVGGHTQEDLLIFIPKSTGQKGVIFYVDVVFPGWSIPFNLGTTQNVRAMIIAHEEMLKLDFDILVPGHFRVGTKKDVSFSISFIEDLLKTSKKVLGSVTPEQFAQAGIGKLQDPKAREYRNTLYGGFLTRKLEIDACYREIIEKWGCRLAGLDIFLRGHCFVGITFIWAET